MKTPQNNMDVVKLWLAEVQTDGIVNCRKDLQVDDLKDSIQAVGMQTPVGVSYNSKQQPVLVYGFRRFEAMRQLGELSIYARVIEDTDPSHLYLLNLQENVTRKNLSPIEEAEAIQRLLDMGKTTEEFAPALGWSKTLITQRLSLLDLSDRVQDALHEDALSVRQAKVIDGAKPEHQENLIELAREGATINAIKSELELLEMEVPVEPNDDTIIAPIDDEEFTSDTSELGLSESADDKKALAEANSNIVKATLLDCGAKSIIDDAAYFAFEVALNCVDFSRLPKDQLDALVSAIGALGGEYGLNVWGESVKRQ